MARTYIVEGSTGEYDSHRTWLAASFSSPSRAATFAERANQWLRDNNLHDEFYSSRSTSARQKLAATSPFDPDLDVDYTGASYSVVSTRHNPRLPR